MQGKQMNNFFKTKFDIPMIIENNLGKLFDNM